jgi:hypothetical protein
MEAIKFNLFLILCIYLFFFFLYSHLKMTGAQLISRVMTKIKLLLFFFYCCYKVITFQDVSDNLTNSFNILTQRFVLSFMAAESPTKCVWLFGKFKFIRATLSTGNNKDTVSCLSIGLLPWRKNKPLHKNVEAIGQIVTETFWKGVTFFNLISVIKRETSFGSTAIQQNWSQIRG